MFIARLCLALVFGLAAWSVQAVNVNQASAAQLQQIKGIGPKTAESIIAERTRGGDFESLQDLSNRVKGIGPKRLAGLEASGLTVKKESKK